MHKFETFDFLVAVVLITSPEMPYDEGQRGAMATPLDVMFQLKICHSTVEQGPQEVQNQKKLNRTQQDPHRKRDVTLLQRRREATALNHWLFELSQATACSLIVLDSTSVVSLSGWSSCLFAKEVLFCAPRWQRQVSNYIALFPFKFLLRGLCLFLCPSIFMSPTSR